MSSNINSLFKVSTRKNAHAYYFINNTGKAVPIRDIAYGIIKTENKGKGKAETIQTRQARESISILSWDEATATFTYENVHNRQLITCSITDLKEARIEKGWKASTYAVGEYAASHLKSNSSQYLIIRVVLAILSFIVYPFIALYHAINRHREKTQTNVGIFETVSPQVVLHHLKFMKELIAEHASEYSNERQLVQMLDEAFTSGQLIFNAAQSQNQKKIQQAAGKLASRFKAINTIPMLIPCGIGEGENYIPHFLLVLPPSKGNSQLQHFYFSSPLHNGKISTGVSYKINLSRDSAEIFFTELINLQPVFNKKNKSIIIDQHSEQSTLEKMLNSRFERIEDEPVIDRTSSLDLAKSLHNIIDIISSKNIQVNAADITEALQDNPIFAEFTKQISSILESDVSLEAKKESMIEFDNCFKALKEDIQSRGELDLSIISQIKKNKNFPKFPPKTTAKDILKFYDTVIQPALNNIEDQIKRRDTKLQFYFRYVNHLIEFYKEQEKSLNDHQRKILLNGLYKYAQQLDIMLQSEAGISIANQVTSPLIQWINDQASSLKLSEQKERLDIKDLSFSTVIATTELKDKKNVKMTKSNLALNETRKTLLKSKTMLAISQLGALDKKKYGDQKLRLELLAAINTNLPIAENFLHNAQYKNARILALALLRQLPAAAQIGHKTFWDHLELQEINQWMDCIDQLSKHMFEACLKTQSELSPEEVLFYILNSRVIIHKLYGKICELKSEEFNAILTQYLAKNMDQKLRDQAYDTITKMVKKAASQREKTLRLEFKKLDPALIQGNLDSDTLLKQLKTFDANSFKFDKLDPCLQGIVAKSLHIPVDLCAYRIVPKSQEYKSYMEVSLVDFTLVNDLTLAFGANQKFQKLYSAILGYYKEILALGVTKNHYEYGHQLTHFFDGYWERDVEQQNKPDLSAISYGVFDKTLAEKYFVPNELGLCLRHDIMTSLVKSGSTRVLTHYIPNNFLSAAVAAGKLIRQGLFNSAVEAAEFRKNIESMKRITLCLDERKISLLNHEYVYILKDSADTAKAIYCYTHHSSVCDDFNSNQLFLGKLPLALAKARTPTNSRGIYEQEVFQNSNSDIKFFNQQVIGFKDIYSELFFSYHSVQAAFEFLYQYWNKIEEDEISQHRLFEIFFYPELVVQLLLKQPDFFIRNKAVLQEIVTKLYLPTESKPLTLLFILDFCQRMRQLIEVAQEYIAIDPTDYPSCTSNKLNQIALALPAYDVHLIGQLYSANFTTENQKTVAIYLLNSYYFLPEQKIQDLILTDWQKILTSFFVLKVSPLNTGHPKVINELSTWMNCTILPLLNAKLLADNRFRDALLSLMSGQSPIGGWQTTNDDYEFITNDRKENNIINIYTGVGFDVRIRFGRSGVLPTIVRECDDYKFLFGSHNPFVQSELLSVNVMSYTWEYRDIPFTLHYHYKIKKIEIFQIHRSKHYLFQQASTSSTSFIDQFMPDKELILEKMIENYGIWQDCENQSQFFIAPNNHDLNQSPITLHLSGKKVKSATIGEGKELKYLCNETTAIAAQAVKCRSVKQMMLFRSRHSSHIDEIRFPEGLILLHNPKDGLWHVNEIEGEWYWQLKDTQTAEKRFGPNYREFILPLVNKDGDEKYWVWAYPTYQIHSRRELFFQKEDPSGQPMQVPHFEYYYGRGDMISRRCMSNGHFYPEGYFYLAFITSLTGNYSQTLLYIQSLKNSSEEHQFNDYYIAMFLTYLDRSPSSHHHIVCLLKLMLNSFQYFGDSALGIKPYISQYYSHYRFLLNSGHFQEFKESGLLLDQNEEAILSNLYGQQMPSPLKMDFAVKGTSDILSCDFPTKDELKKFSKVLASQNFSNQNQSVESLHRIEGSYPNNNTLVGHFWTYWYWIAYNQVKAEDLTFLWHDSNDVIHPNVAIARKCLFLLYVYKTNHVGPLKSDAVEENSQNKRNLLPLDFDYLTKKMLEQTEKFPNIGEIEDSLLRHVKELSKEYKTLTLIQIGLLSWRRNRNEPTTLQKQNYSEIANNLFQQILERTEELTHDKVFTINGLRNMPTAKQVVAPVPLINIPFGAPVNNFSANLVANKPIMEWTDTPITQVDQTIWDIYFKTLDHTAYWDQKAKTITDYLLTTAGQSLMLQNENKAICAGINTVKQRKISECNRSLQVEQHKIIGTAIENQLVVLEKEVKDTRQSILNFAERYANALNLGCYFSNINKREDEEILSLMEDLYQDNQLYGLKSDKLVLEIEELMTHHLLAKTEWQSKQSALRIHQKMAEQLKLMKKQTKIPDQLQILANGTRSNVTNWVLDSQQLLRFLEAGSNRLRYCDQKEGVNYLKSPQLYRKYLVTEARANIICRPKAIEAIHDVLEKSTNLGILRMGLGKSSFVLPLAVRFLLERNTRPIVVTTEQLIDQLKGFIKNKIFEFKFDISYGIDEKILNALKPEAREEAIVDQLEKTLAMLMSLKQKGQAVISTPQRLAAVYLKRADLEVKLSKCAPNSIEEIITFKKLELIKKIEFYFHDPKANIRNIYDEDNNYEISLDHNVGMGDLEQLDPFYVKMAYQLVLSMFKFPDLKKKLIDNDLRSLSDPKIELRRVVADLIGDFDLWVKLGWSKETWLKCDQEELIDYVLGIQSDFPKGLPQWADHEKNSEKNYLSALKNLVADCFMNVAFTHPKLQKGISSQNGCEVKPFLDGNEVKNRQYGNIAEMTLHHYLYYAANCCTEERFISEFSNIKFLKEWEQWCDKIISIADRDFKSDYYKAICSETCFIERIQFLNYLIENTKLIRIYKEQLFCNNQTITLGEENYVISGTGRKFSLNLASIDDEPLSEDEITAETLLSINLAEPLSIFKDAFEHLKKRAADPDCHAFMNAGYEINGSRAEKTIALLRATGNERQFAYRESTTLTKKIWNPGQISRPMDYNTHAIDPKKFFALFDYRDIRGVDMEGMPTGETNFGELLLEIDTTLDAFNQASLRQRKIGLGQIGRVACDERTAFRIHQDRAETIVWESFPKIRQTLVNQILICYHKLYLAIQQNSDSRSIKNELSALLLKAHYSEKNIQDLISAFVKEIEIPITIGDSIASIIKHTVRKQEAFNVKAAFFTIKKPLHLNINRVLADYYEIEDAFIPLCAALERGLFAVHRNLYVNQRKTLNELDYKPRKTVEQLTGLKMQYVIERKKLENYKNDLKQFQNQFCKEHLGELIANDINQLIQSGKRDNVVLRLEKHGINKSPFTTLIYKFMDIWGAYKKIEQTLERKAKELDSDENVRKFYKANLPEEVAVVTQETSASQQETQQQQQNDNLNQNLNQHVNQQLCTRFSPRRTPPIDAVSFFLNNQSGYTFYSIYAWIYNSANKEIKTKMSDTIPIHIRNSFISTRALTFLDKTQALGEPVLYLMIHHTTKESWRSCIISRDEWVESIAPQIEGDCIRSTNKFGLYTIVVPLLHNQLENKLIIDANNLIIDGKDQYEDVQYDISWAMALNKLLLNRTDFSDKEFNFLFAIGEDNIANLEELYNLFTLIQYNASANSLENIINEIKTPTKNSGKEEE